MPELLHRKKHLTTFQIIILGFASVIFLGAFLLMLPVSSQKGHVTPFMEASGYGKLLEHVWAECYFAFNPDWRNGSGNSRGFDCHDIWQKNISYAKKHYAGGNCSAKGGRDCQINRIHY